RRWIAGSNPAMTDGALQRAIAFLHRIGIDIELAAKLAKSLRHLRHALLLVVERRRIVAHVLRDLHRAEFRPAHGAEMRHLVRLLWQGLVVIFARGVRIER